MYRKESDQWGEDTFTKQSEQYQGPPVGTSQSHEMLLTVMGTSTSPIPVTVTFSESVTGFTAGDITAGNATVSNFTGSGASYSFDLTPASDGSVTADIAAGAAQDSVLNNTTAAAQFSREYDSLPPPAPVVTSPASSSSTNDTTPR